MLATLFYNYSKPTDQGGFPNENKALPNYGLGGGGCDRSVEFDCGCRRRSG
jgi:hypothetical protein